MGVATLVPSGVTLKKELLREGGAVRAINSRVLVARLSLRRVLDVIDYQNLRRCFLRLQFQPKLLLHRIHERRLTLIRASLAVVPMQIEIVTTVQTCLVDDWGPQLPRELLRKIVERSTMRSDAVHLIPADLHTPLLPSHVHRSLLLVFARFSGTCRLQFRAI